MLETILFDLDGTLSDSAPGITRCVDYALRKFGIEPESLESLNHFVGPPLRESFTDSYGFDYDQCTRAIEYYRERYRAKGIFETTPYPGVCEMLRELRAAGRCLALATSKPTVFARQIVAEYGIADCFELVLGCELDGTRGEKIGVMRECLATLGIAGEALDRTAMVGDRKYDIESTQLCGVHAIAVSYGYAPPGELEAAGAEITVADSGELLRCLMAE